MRYPLVPERDLSKARLSREELDLHHRLCSPEFQASLASKVDVKKYFAKLEERAEFIVYRSNGVVVGLLAYYVRTDGNLFISHFSVASSFRRMGIGSMLFRTLLQQEGKTGSELSVELQVERSNRSALAFYEELGFRSDLLEARKIQTPGAETELTDQIDLIFTKRSDDCEVII